jgi:hypothetical protein
LIGVPFRPLNRRRELIVSRDELRRPMGDLGLEVFLLEAQLSILLLDFTEHAVEVLDQRADLVVARRRRA